MRCVVLVLGQKGRCHELRACLVPEVRNVGWCRDRHERIWRNAFNVPEISNRGSRVSRAAARDEPLLRIIAALSSGHIKIVKRDVLVTEVNDSGSSKRCSRRHIITG